MIKKRMKVVKRAHGGCALAVALYCQTAAAAPPPPLLDMPRSQAFLYELELGGYYSDNRAQTQPGSDSGFVLLPRLHFNLYRQGARIEAQARGTAEYFQWVDDSDTSDLRVQLALALDAAIVPGLFHWGVQNQAETRRTEFRLPESTDNLQQVNVFATGPSLRIRPQAPWSGLFEAEYVRTYAEESSEFDSDRLIASGWLLHAPHARRDLQFGVEASEVRFDNQTLLNPDFDRIDYLARYRSDFNRLDLELTGGHTRIRFDDGQRVSGPLARAVVAFDINESHRLTALGVREYSDLARDLLLDVSRFDRPRNTQGGPAVASGQYRLTGAELSWYGRLIRTDWRLTSYSRDFDYPRDIDDDPLSHRANGISAQIGYALSATQRLRFDTMLERRRFEQDGRTDRDRYFGVHFDQQLSERWTVRTGWTWFSPKADAADTRWTEQIISFALVWNGGL